MKLGKATFFTLLTLALGFSSSFLSADERFKSGAVYARSVVLDENGQPIMVEYNDDGTEAGEVPQSVTGSYQDDIEQLRIMSAAEYHFYEQQYEDFLEQHQNDIARGAELMTLDEFNNTPFQAIDGTVITGDNITEGESVLVLAQSYRFPQRDASGQTQLKKKDLILLTFPVVLSKPGPDQVNPDTHKSVILSPEGEFLYASANTIAYRVGFFGDPDDPQVGSNFFRTNDDEIFGPIPGVKVYVDEFAYPGGVDVTGNDGKYSFRYRLPLCPLGGFEFTTDVWAEVRYTNFIPTGARSIPFYLRRQEWDYCFAQLVPGPLGFGAFYSSPSPSVYSIIRSDLRVDVMFVMGKISMENPDGTTIEVVGGTGGGATTYHSLEGEEERVTQDYYDFNGDGNYDTPIKGKRLAIDDAEGNSVDAFVPESCPAAANEPDLQGIYFEEPTFTGCGPELLEVQPAFVRILDRKKRIEEATGYLATITEDDLKNTDVLFFRESTGELVMERRGLRQDEVEIRPVIFVDDTGPDLSYRVMLRGPRDSDLNIGGGSRTGGYSQWAARNFLTQPFLERDANHLKPGEIIQIVAINRATGYVGTASAKLSSASQNPSNFLSIEVPKIIMQPPNLKIWAERNFNIEHGLLRDLDGDGQVDDEDTNLIGNEGAGLTSDTTITIYTEWLDENGRPLPDGISVDGGENFGLTGRLAKVTEDNQIGPATGVSSDSGSDLAEFPIPPGRKTQAITVSSNLTAAEHYYVHVIGKARDSECNSVGNCPDFSNDPSVEPPYDSRPALFTPFLTPLFDEDTHWQAYNEYRELQRDYDPSTNPNTVEPTKPLPAYVWQYRPEYQFSQYELEVQDLNRIAIDVNGNTNTTNILESENPTIASSDDLIAALYSLISSNYSRLTPIDGVQELILALGEEEQLITFGTDQTISFSNIDHLASLDPEDFLSMRLYTNNDAGNVLWEWAFSKLLISLPKVTGAEPFEMSVDQAQNFAISGLLITGDDDPFRVNWSIDGGGQLLRTSQLSQTPDFYNSVNLPTTPNTLVGIQVQTENSGLVRFETIKMVPGAPNQINVQQSGKTTVDGFGEIEIVATVLDQYGNSVVDGTLVTLNSELLAGENTQIIANGEVTFQMVGADMAGDESISIVAGDITQELGITVHNVDVTISVAQEVAVSATVPVTVSAVSTYGDLTGLPISVSAIRGTFPQQEITLGAGNTASFPMYVGDFRGEGSVYAYFSDIVSFQAFEVVEDKSNGYLLDSVIVDGGGGVGSFSSGGETFEYTGTTNIVLQGTPGSTTSLELNDYLDPPFLPELKYSLEERPHPLTNQVADSVIGLQANTANINLVPSAFNASFWAYEFDVDSIVSFDYPYLTNVQNLGFVLNLRIDENTGVRIGDPDTPNTATVFEHPGSGLALEITSTNTLIWKKETINGVWQIVTQELAEGWHRVGAHLIAGQLVIQVDDEILKDIETPNGATLGTDNTVRLGENLAGAMSGLTVYDWDASPIVAFTNGSLQTEAVLDASGRAAVPVVSSNQNLFAGMVYKRLQYQADLMGSTILEVALAQSDSCAAAPAPSDSDEFDYGEVLGQAEAMFKNLAECNYLPKIKKAFITLDSDAGTFRKSIAVVELAAYIQLYVSMKASELALALGPSCVKGIIVGQATSFAEGTCEFISSLFLIGDLRDFALHSAWLFSGEVLGSDSAKAKYDKAIYIFASIGIITTLAELTGVGIVVDAAVAGCKTAAKIFKGNRYLFLLANQAKKNILKNWKDSAKLKVGFKLMLPGMQITAMVVLLRDDFGKIFDILKEMEPHQIEGILKYAQTALNDAAGQIVYETSTSIEIEYAYAALNAGDIARILDGDGKVRIFMLAILKATEKVTLKVTTTRVSYQYKVINAAMEHLGKRADEILERGDDLTGLRDLIANDDVLTAFAIAFDIGQKSSDNIGDALVASQKIMDDIVNIKCYPSVCQAFREIGDALGTGAQANPQVLRVFLNKLSEFAELRKLGKVTDEAYIALEKVTSDFSKNTRSLRFQIGAAHLINDAVKVAKKLAEKLTGNADNFRIVNFEKFEDVVTDVGVIGKRKYDVLIEINGVIYQVEMKSWRPDKFREYMASSLNGLKKISTIADDLPDVVPGQMSKDLAEALVQAGIRFENGVLRLDANSLQNITKRWNFDSRITPSDAIGDVLDILNKDPDLVKQLLIATGRISGDNIGNIGPTQLKQLLGDGGILKAVLDTIFSA